MEKEQNQLEESMANVNAKHSEQSDGLSTMSEQQKEINKVVANFCW